MLRVAVVASIVAGSIAVGACSRSQPSTAKPSTAKPSPGTQAATPAAEPTKPPPLPVQVPEFIAQPADEDDYAPFLLVGVTPTVAVTMPRAATSAELLGKIGRVFVDVQRRLGRNDPTRGIGRVNALAGTAAVPIDDDIRWLLARSLKLGADTGGAFDVTASVLRDGWAEVGLGRAATRGMLDEKLALVGAANVVIDKAERAVALKKKGMTLALDVLAVGYAMDGVAELLVAAGVTSFRIDSDGQVLVAGGKAGRQWRIELRDGRDKADKGSGFAAIDLWQGSVAKTRGNIVDPRNGHRVEDVGVVFVVGKDATMGRARAEAIAVLGPQDGLVAASGWKDIRAIVADTTGKLHMSPGLADALIVRRNVDP